MAGHRPRRRLPVEAVYRRREVHLAPRTLNTGDVGHGHRPRLGGREVVPPVGLQRQVRRARVGLNLRAEINLRDLIFGKWELSYKVLETDVEACRPRVEGRVEDIASGREGACRVFYADAAPSLDPDEARATLQFALAVAAQAVNQTRVNARRAQPESERYALRCWMAKMGLVGDEYEPMRRRFLERLRGDSATKALRANG